MSTHLESGSATHTVSDQASSLGDIIELGLAPEGTWQQNNLTAITGAPQTATAPFAYVAPDESGRVVYQDSSGGITELWLPPGAATWRYDSLTAVTGAPQASSAPMALVTPGNVARVIYQDSSGGITELSVAPGGTWQYDSLTAITGAPLSAGAPFAYVTPDNVTRVVYNTSGGIIELSLPQGGTWQQNNLTAAITPTPLPAASAPFAYVTPDGTARVLYLEDVFAVVGPGGGQAQGIAELSLAPGGTWQYHSLTAITGAPYPAESRAPFAYVGADGLARVVYTGNSGDVAGSDDVIELRLDPDGWVHSDLTISVNPPAPPAASGPFAYVGADGLARVLYTGSNGDLVELRLNGDVWVCSDLTISVNSPPAPPAASAPFAYVTPDKVDRVYYLQSLAMASPPGSGLGSNSNYILASDCNPLLNLSVSITVTEDIVCESVSGSDDPNFSQEGFSFQLNAYSPQNETTGYQQYVLALWGTDIKGWINNYYATGDIDDYFTLASVPNAAILPAGYKLGISLQNDASGNVTGVTYAVTDNQGNTLANVTTTLESIGVTAAEMAPIVAFELDVVGPGAGERAVLSSGAGTIFYEAGATPLTALSTVPPCAEWPATGTAETANSFYGELPGAASNFFAQAFYVSAEAPAVRRQGKIRPSLRIRR